jgi:hypothetical protein
MVEASIFHLDAIGDLAGVESRLIEDMLHWTLWRLFVSIIYQSSYGVCNIYLNVRYSGWRRMITKYLLHFTISFYDSIMRRLARKVSGSHSHIRRERNGS